MIWERKIFNRQVWHEWFAWHPVVVYRNDKRKIIAWLERVERVYDGWWRFRELPRKRLEREQEESHASSEI